jgi:hypothetical protein
VLGVWHQLNLAPIIDGMAKVNPYTVGDAVLASRAQDGTNHEEAKVVDAYSLLMSGDEVLMVVVEFPDEQRVWLKAESDDVIPIPEEEDEEGDVEDLDQEESDDDGLEDEEEVDS